MEHSKRTQTRPNPRAILRNRQTAGRTPSFEMVKNKNISKAPTAKNTDDTVSTNVLGKLPITTEIVTFQQFGEFSGLVSSVLSTSLPECLSAVETLSETMSQISGVVSDSLDTVSGEISTLFSITNDLEETTGNLLDKVADNSSKISGITQEISGLSTGLSDEINTAVSAVSSQLSNYVPLSGNSTITGDIVMDSRDIIHTATNVNVPRKNIVMNNYTEGHYVGSVAFTYYREDAGDLLNVTASGIRFDITGVPVGRGLPKTTEAVLVNGVFPDGSENSVEWNICTVADGMKIGHVTFTSTDEEFPVCPTAVVFDDELTFDKYAVDTVVPELADVKKYVYDIATSINPRNTDDKAIGAGCAYRMFNALSNRMSGYVENLATKTEVEEFENSTSSSLNELSTIVDGLSYTYRTIVASETPGAGVVVDVKNREVVGIVCDEETSPNIQINFPAPVEGKVIDFVVDICNRTENRVRTLLNFGSRWNPVLEEGDLLASYSYIEAGKTERLVFKQVGFPGGSGTPQLYLSRKYLI